MVPLPAGAPGCEGISAEDFREGFGEELCEALRVESWHTGADLGEVYRRIEQAVAQAVAAETALQQDVRARLLPRLAEAPGAPPGAGHYRVELSEIEEVQRGLLFSGGVEACDGNSNFHDTLALTIYQIGVSLVSYRGEQGSWCQRLFRRDLRQGHGDPVGEALELLERRGRRGGLYQPAPRDPLSELARRALMSYAERAVLLRHSKAVWRMGHGSPAPFELLYGAGSPDLMIESVKVIRELVLGHQKFVFVASEPDDRVLISVGGALRPLEYAVVGTLRDRLVQAVAGVSFRARVTVDATWDGARLRPEQWVRRLRDDVASQVVVGVYRATLLAPPQVFYAHVDHADLAARVALADSVFHEARGFPTLIELADQGCRSVYGGASLREMAEAAYVAAGAPFRYHSERATRERS
jgi:hypothetical protein